MPDVILVQAISTTWTKASRGGRLATLRDGIPQEIAIPLSGTPARGMAYLLHEVRYDESNEFQVPVFNRMQAQPMPTFLKPANGNVAIEVTDGTVRVALAWSWGAPMRDRKVDLFTLGCGEWGRVRYNFRSSGNQAWNYAHWIFNIGVFATPDLHVDLFTSTSPNHRYVNLADLW